MSWRRVHQSKRHRLAPTPALQLGGTESLLPPHQRHPCRQAVGSPRQHRRFLRQLAGSPQPGLRAASSTALEASTSNREKSLRQRIRLLKVTLFRLRGSEKDCLSCLQDSGGSIEAPLTGSDV